MKKLFTKIYCITAVVLLFLGASLHANAQYTINKIGNNVWASAVCNDASGNVYVIEAATTNSFNDNGKVLKYTNGTGTPTTVYSGSLLPFDNCDAQQGNFPAGIVVTTNGDIYVTTTSDYYAGNCASTYGSILRIAYNSGNGTYAAPQVFLAGTAAFGSFTSLAVDASNNLYVLLFDTSGNGGAATAVTDPNTGAVLHGSYEIEEFPASAGVPQAGSATRIAAADAFKLDVNALNSADGYSGISGLTVDPSGNIYVADAFDVTGGAGSDQGRVYKLTKSGSTYITSTFTTGQCTTALGSDAAGNVYATNAPNFWVTADHGPSGFPAFALVEYKNGSAGSTQTIYSALDIGGTEQMYIQTIAAINSSDIFVDDGSESGTDNGDFDQIIGPTITLSGSPAALSTITGTASSSTSFNVSGSNLASGNLTVTAPSGFDVSANNSTWSGSGGNFTIAVNGTLSSTPVYVRLDAGDAVNSYSGNVTISGGGAITKTQAIPSGTVSAQPLISTTGTPSALSTTSGTASSSTSFNVSGSNLVANITATAPSGFDISLDNSTWSGSGGSKTLTESSGTLASSPVYVRLDAGDAVTSYSGNVSLTSTSATTVNVGIPSSSVTSPSTTISSLTAVTSTITNASSVQYTATFAASITGLSTADFTLNTSGVSGASVTSVSGSGTSWTVTVNTGSGDGTIQLSMNSSSGVSPSVSNIPFNGATYTIDKTAPTLSISAPTVTIANSTTYIDYTVTYNDANLGTLPSQPIGALQVFNNLVYTGNVSLGSLQVFNSVGNTVKIEFHGITGDGTLGFSIPAGTANDQAGNAALASPASATFIVDNTPPSINISAPSVSSTLNGPVTYTVTYADANFNTSTLGLGDITLNSTGTATGTVGISGSGTSYTVTISGISGGGTLGISIGAGTASDLAGNSAAASSASSTFTVDNTPPTVSISAPSVIGINNGGSGTVTYTVTYADGDFNTSSLTTSGITLNSTGTATGTVGVSGSGTSYTVTISSITGVGTLGISVGAGYASDLVGNTDAGAGPSSTFIVGSNDATLSVFQISNGVLSPVFSPATTSYTDAIANTTASITLLLQTNNPGSTVTVDGNTVSSGVRTSGIPMSVGANTLTVVVTAQDGVTTQTYTVTVTRSLPSVTNLTTLTLTPATTLALTTGPGNLNYKASVPYSTASVQVTPTAQDALATIVVNGNAVSSGSLSQVIPLNVGANTITTVVTAEDGVTTKTIIITVTRALSTVASLSNLSISTGTLSPAFAAATNVYGASEPYTTNSVTVTPATTDPNATVTVNGTAVTSGSPSSAIALNVGANTITTVVTAQNGIVQQTYSTIITRAVPSTNSSLASIALSPAATLVNVAGPDWLDYTAAVPNSESSVQVIPTVIDPTATITVNGNAVASGATSSAISLNIGANTITTVVTAQDGVSTKTTVITVTRAGSSNAALNNLAISAGTLSPAFATGTNVYGAAEPYTTATVTVTPTTADPNATVTVNGTAVTSGSPSTAIALNVGQNTITTVVTAQNGIIQQTYTTIITRAVPSTNSSLASIALSPAATLVTVAGPDWLDYTAAVPNSESSVQVIPTAIDPTATITVNGNAVASGATSSAISLNVGANTITTVVTAQDGVSTKTTVITVTRAGSSNAALNNLAISAGTLSPVFATGTYAYSASVANTVTSVNITPTTADATATVTVNGNPATSGSASAVTLALGHNIITTLVTAQNGTTTKTYTVNIDRIPSTNALLASIKVTPATSLLSTTGSGYLNFKTSVPNSEASVQVTPTAKDATATITVNGSTVISGSLSQAIALNVGANTITTVITAQDGVTTKTIIITATRAAGPIANLAQAISVEQTPTVSMETDGIVVHQGVSPNGDGINDFLVIDGIAAYPENKLTIINRNGGLVYEAQGYDNTSKVFDGHSNKTGAMQVPGTYFYALDYSVNGVAKHKTGFIILKY